nr:histidine kinase [Streptomyces sp. DSM 41633]
MNAPPPSGRGPRRFGWPQRVFSPVLLMQLAVVTGVTVLVTGLFLAPLGDRLDEEAMLRALAIARSTAAQPGIAEDLRTTEPSAPGPVQSAAERVRRATGAEYVVVMD